MQDNKPQVIDIVRNTTRRFVLGFIFTAEDFPIPMKKQNTVTKILNNMVVAGQTKVYDATLSLFVRT